MPHIDCEVCASSFYVKPSSLKRGCSTRYCSMNCRHLAEKTDRFIRSDGYAAVKDDDDKWVLEHRQLMERHVGRKLDTREHVHHINEVKDDNRLENLKILMIEDHSSLHAQGKILSTWVQIEYGSCGEKFNRRKTEQERHPEAFCSRECYIEQRESETYKIVSAAIPLIKKGQCYRGRDFCTLIQGRDTNWFMGNLVKLEYLVKIAYDLYYAFKTPTDEPSINSVVDGYLFHRPFVLTGPPKWLEIGLKGWKDNNWLVYTNRSSKNLCIAGFEFSCKTRKFPVAPVTEWFIIDALNNAKSSNTSDESFISTIHEKIKAGDLDLDKLIFYSEEYGRNLGRHFVKESYTNFEENKEVTND